MAAARALPVLEGWFTLALHQAEADAIGAGGPAARDRFVRSVTLSPQWRTATASARRRGRAGPDVLLVCCAAATTSAAWDGGTFAGWLRARLAAPRLVASPRRIRQDLGRGTLCGVGAGPAWSVLFGEHGERPFGPDLIAAAMAADRSEHGTTPAVRTPGGHGLTGGHDWAGGAKIRLSVEITGIEPAPDARTWLGSMPGLLTLQTHGTQGNLVEVTTAPALRYDDERNGADPVAVLRAADAAVDQLILSTGRPLAALLPERLASVPALGGAQVRTALANSMRIHLTEGIPLEALYHLYTRLAADQGPRVTPVVHDAIEFGRGLAEWLTGEPVAGSGPAVTLAGYGALLYTLFRVLAEEHLRPAGLPRDRLDFAPRVPLDRIYAALPRELRLVLQLHRPAIERRLAGHLAHRSPRLLRRLADWGAGEDRLLHQYLPGTQTTLSDLLSGGLTSEATGNVTPERLGLHTALEGLDDNRGGLRHTALVVGEFPRIGGMRASHGWRTVEAWLGRTARRLYRDTVTARTVTGAPAAAPMDLAAAAHRLRAAAGPDDGPLRRLRLTAARLLEQLRQEPSTVRLAAPDDLDAVESVHIRLDAATRAAVVTVDVSGVTGLPDRTLDLLAGWFPNAELHTPSGVRAPVRYRQHSDRFAGANSAPQRIDLAELTARLDAMTNRAGGVLALGRMLGVPGDEPAVAQALRDAAYLTAAVYGAGFDAAQLRTVRRMAELAAGSGGTGTLWSDLEALAGTALAGETGGAGGDAAPAGGDAPGRTVHRSQVRLLADEVARIGAGGTLDDLRRRLRAAPDLAAALAWAVPADQETVSPFWSGAGPLLVQLRALAPAGLPALTERVTGAHDARALFDAARITATFYGLGGLTVQRLGAMHRLLALAAAATRAGGPVSLLTVEQFVRLLFNEAPRPEGRVYQQFAHHYARPLVELIQSLDGDVTLSRLRRQVTGIDAPAGPMAQALHRVWRGRLRFGYLANHEQPYARLRHVAGLGLGRSPDAGRERAFWDQVALLHAAFGEFEYVAGEDLAALLVLAGAAGGTDRLRTWADLQRLVRLVRGPLRPASGAAGADIDDVRSLLRAAADLRTAVPDRRITLEDLRGHWSPPGAGEPQDAAGRFRVDLDALQTRLETLAADTGGVDGLAAAAGVPSTLPTETTLQELGYLAAAVNGPDFTTRDLAAVRHLVELATFGLRTGSGWGDLEALVRAIRRDEPGRARFVHAGHVRLLADLVGGGEAPGFERLRDMSGLVPELAMALRWEAPFDSVTESPGWGTTALFVRLGELGPDPTGGSSGLPARVTGRDDPDAEQALWDAAHVALALYGLEFTEEDLAAVHRTLRSTMPGPGRPLAGWGGIDGFARYLFHEWQTALPEGEPSESGTGRPLHELLAALDGQVTLVDLHRSAVGVDGAAAAFLSQPSRAALRLRYEQAGRYQPLADAVRVPGADAERERRLFEDALSLVHATFDAGDGARWASAGELVAARALLEVRYIDDGPQLRTWSGLRALIVELRGPHRPQPAHPAADVEDLRSLLEFIARRQRQTEVTPVGVDDLVTRWRPPSPAGPPNGGVQGRVGPLPGSWPLDPGPRFGTADRPADTAGPVAARDALRTAVAVVLAAGDSAAVTARVIKLRGEVGAAERVATVHALARLAEAYPQHRDGLRRIGAALVDC
ncbi:hypothetical protein ABT369_25745 [Dactylosporangium sp. NPDC000244]|uniref:hypothetical protein n=1 Tax=Dactylosporangium sp. NPDC000244 TaxID=3154365 RepID=UPI00331EB329